MGPRLAQYSLHKGLLLTQHHTLGHPLHSMHSMEAAASPWHLVGSHEHEGVAMLRQDAPGQLVRLHQQADTIQGLCTGSVYRYHLCPVVTIGPRCPDPMEA